MSDASIFLTTPPDKSAGISFDVIDNILGTASKGADTKFEAAMKTFEDGKQTTQDALKFQRASQEWKFSQDAVSEVTKSFGEIMKSIIQKA
jgi:hypothetical protein